MLVSELCVHFGYLVVAVDPLRAVIAETELLL